MSTVIWNAFEHDSLVVSTSPQTARNWTDSDRDVFSSYADKLYETFGVRVIPFDQIRLAENEHPVYFNDSAYIPHFRSCRYDIQVVTGTRLDEALDRLPANSLVLLAVLDDGSQAVVGPFANKLRSFSIHLSPEHLRHSYVWIARKNEASQWQVLFEEISQGVISVTSGQFPELEWSTAFQVTSGGALTGNICRIETDIWELDQPRRGMNLCVMEGESGRVRFLFADTFSTEYCSDTWYKAVPPKRYDEHAWLKEDMAIAHACGSIAGTPYTNCLEALNHSYVQNGFRLFEIDLIATSDGSLACRHDWLPYLYDYLQQEPPVPNDGAPLSLEQFQTRPILGRYTPLGIRELLEFLHRHPDARVITDTKSTVKEEVEALFRILVKEAEPFGLDMPRRFIPQIYSFDMYDWLHAIYPEWQMMLTLYQTHASDQDILSFVQKKPVAAIVMSLERFTPHFARRLRGIGVKVVLHTINDLEIMNRYVGADADGIMTDSIAAEAIRTRRKVHAAEEAAYHHIVSEVLLQHYGISKREYSAYLHTHGADLTAREIAADLIPVTSKEDILQKIKGRPRS